MALPVSRLALLMQVLGVSGYDAAVATDIDPSLISKWKRNRRRVPGRTDAMAKLADYLLAVDDRQGGQTLRPLLASIAGGPIERPDEVGLLTQWLLDPDVSGWFAETDNVAGIRLDENCYTCMVEAYRGAQGRRRAVLRFMESIREMPAGVTLMALIQEEASWAQTVPEFQLQFKQMVNVWLASGHHLESIHWIDQQPGQLQNLIHHWLPLHFSGSVKTWYHPAYADNVLPMSILLIPGHAALVTHGSGDDPPDYHTILYTDQAAVQQFEFVIRRVRQRCLPLLESFQHQSLPDLVDRFSDNWRQVRNRSVSLHSLQPFLIGMSASQLDEVFAENKIPAERRQAVIDQWGAFVNNQDGTSQIRLVHHLGQLERLLDHETTVDPLLSALVGQPVVLRREHVRESLRALSRSVRQNEDFEVALVRSDVFGRSAWPNLLVVANAFMTAWGAESEHNRLFSQEATLVHAFEHYFNERWRQIPRVCRDRQVVGTLLDELARSGEQ